MGVAAAKHNQFLKLAAPMKLLLTIFLSLAAAAQAQVDFHAYPGTEDLIEGGRIEKLTVVSSNLQFNVRPPAGWSRQVDEASRKIIFTSQSGKSAVIVQFTTNSPGTLPERDILKAQAQQAHPGSGVVQCAVAPTSYKPGVFVDLACVPAPHVVQRIRHAFVAHPVGEVEFILSSSEDEFDKTRLVIMAMLRAFRVDPIKSKLP
jgi:hypothetical protein